MRSQDLRLAVHSLWSNLDLSVSLLAKVADDESLGVDERAEAGRLRDDLVALCAETDAADAERRSRISHALTALSALDTAVNGPVHAGKP